MSVFENGISHCKPDIRSHIRSQTDVLLNRVASMTFEDDTTAVLVFVRKSIIEEAGKDNGPITTDDYDIKAIKGFESYLKASIVCSSVAVKGLPVNRVYATDAKVPCPIDMYIVTDTRKLHERKPKEAKKEEPNELSDFL